MAARLARAKATVVTPEQTLEGVSITVRNDIATVRLGAEVLIERADVAKVTALGRRSWQLQFAAPTSDSDVWKITDERRSCCGRR